MTEQPDEPLVEYADIDETINNLGKSDEYASFIAAMEKVVGEQPDIPMSHLLCIAIMDLFGPAFVVIGSAESEEYEGSDGMRVPVDMGVAVNPTTDMTAQDVLYSLQLLVNTMSNDVVTSDDNLEKEFPSE